MTDQKGKLILSNEDVNNNGLKNTEALTFDDLPSVLLCVIMSFLVLKDNIRAAAVCKTWRQAAESVRVVQKHPWVITFPNRGKMVVLFDPSERKRFTLNLPELAGTSVCYSKDGWFLMRRSSMFFFTSMLIFFNPYTRHYINLPKCELSYHAIAFSSAPTSGTCTVLALQPSKSSTVRYTILPPSATQWITLELSYSFAFDRNLQSNLIYAKDRFYFFTKEGVLLELDPASETPNPQTLNKGICPYVQNDGAGWREPQRLYLTEQKGELFLMYTSGDRTPLVYKLVSSNWEEITSNLEGLTIFVSHYSSEMRSDVRMRNSSVYFPKYDLLYNRCVSYSFQDGRYYPRKVIKRKKKGHVQKELCSRTSFWIEPPTKHDLDLIWK